jgi:hypothetical protein
LSKSDGKKATSRSGNYQDNAVAPLDREHDDEAVQQEDEDADEGISIDDAECPAVNLSAITKVAYPFKHTSRAFGNLF